MKKFLLLSLCAIAFAIHANTIPETLYPTPAKRSMDQAVIDRAKPYLKLSPEKYESLVPQESPAPVLTEASSFGSSYNSSICPFCGKTGQWFKYDIINDPDRIYCAYTGKEFRTFATPHTENLTDYRGKKYTRKYFITKHVKNRSNPKQPVKVYPENYFARERIKALLGTWSGGACRMRLSYDM